MQTERLEQQIREHAGDIFGGAQEPPTGHRDRFAARLDKRYLTDSKPETDTKTEMDTKLVPLRKTMRYMTAIAAAIAGIVFLVRYSTTEELDARIVDVRNYYGVRLEEQTDATIKMLQNINGVDSHFLLANIEQLRDEPVPKVQLTDDDYIIFIAQVYTKRLESLQQIQDAIQLTIDN
jgi:hypothetical protein